MSQPAKISGNEYNILLLGETGAGKSTTVNALVNYLKFGGDFKEALASLKDLEEVIPCQFTLPDPKTGSPLTILSGSDPNERQRAGLSATIAPISYVFNFGHNSIRIIDTPGMGDIKGAQEDKENFDQILLHLQNHEKLNAILFVVQGNIARKTLFFKHCITQLLLHLHKSVSDNIIFCFTHSRHSMFGPGDGFSTLKSFLENDIPETKIVLVPGKNSFFIDNESYRFLVAKRQNYPFDEGMEEGYSYTWGRSTKQVVEMLKTIISLEPHNLAKTISLNQARKIIFELAQPMIQMESSISENIANLRKEEEDLKSIESDKDKLKRVLNIEIWDVSSIPLSCPSTVCTNCIELLYVQGVEKVMYNTICHKNCLCLFVQENAVDQWMLKLCEAFDWWLDCKKCGCSCSAHMHITCEYVKVKKTVIDAEKLAEINSATSTIDKLNLAVNNMKTIKSENERELKTIKEISAKFGYLLKNNAFFTHNKVFEDYLQFMIDEENKKEHPNVEPLNKIKKDHQNSIRVLTDAIDQNLEKEVSMDEIPGLKQQLLNLKTNGNKFRDILETNQRAKEEQFKCKEKVVSIGESKKLATKLFAWLYQARWLPNLL